MHAVLGHELRHRQLAFDRIECYFCFKFSAVTIAFRLAHLYSSFPRDEPSLTNCPIRGDPLCCPFAGLWSDKLPRRPLLMVIACWLFVLTSYPAFYLMAAWPSLAACVIAVGWLQLVKAGYSGVLPSL